MDQKHLKAFQTLLDPKGIKLPEEGLGSYETGGRGDTGKAALVLRPSTTEEVSAIVAYCVQQGLAFIPQSGNTGLVGGSIPDDTGTQIILSLQSMNMVHEVDVVNGSVHVDAGVRLWGLNDDLRAQWGLEVPIDLGADPCIGGMVAANTGGSRFLKYRGMREHVLGVRVVLADEKGTIIDALRPFHKDNTGLDVKQLFIGTCGMFGVVTEAILRLSPSLKQRASALLIPKSFSDVSEILIRMQQDCGDYLSAFEGMSGEAMARAIEHVPSLSSPFGPEGIPDYAILMELSRSSAPREGEQSLDVVLEQILAGLWARERTPLETALIGSPEKLWALRHALSEGVQKSGPLYAFDLSFIRGQVMAFCADMRGALADEFPMLTLCDFGHIGDGAVHFNLVHDGSGTVDETALRSWVIERAVKAGGCFSAEHGLGRKNQVFYDRYTPATVKILTRAIKDAIAPGDIGVIKV